MTRRKNSYPGITVITDRHGKRRYRFRMKGKVACYIAGEYGSQEFERAYQAALENKVRQSIGKGAAPFGTFDWLIARYKQTQKFQKIGKTYKTSLMLQFERFQQEYGKALFTDLHTEQVERIIARKANTPAAANELLKLLKRLSRYAVQQEWIARDPTFAVEPYQTNPDGYYTWSDEDIERFENFHGVGSKPVLAERLMQFTGASRQDVVKLGWGNIKGGRLEYKRGKTGELVSLQMSLLPKLEEAIAKIEDGQPRFLVHGKDHEYRPTSFGNWFKDQCRAAGLLQCSAHGLRKAGVLIFTEN